MRQTTRTARPADHKAVRLIEQRWVERAQDEVFVYTADFSNIEDWDPGVVSSRRLGQGPVGVGSQFELVCDTRFKKPALYSGLGTPERQST
jgi:hypothetical protein